MLKNLYNKIFSYNKPFLFKRGFTLLETMVAVGIFTVVVSIGTTAILNVNVTYKKTQTQRALLDNVSFVMEDIARNLRLGSFYRCRQSLTYLKSDSSGDVSAPKNCFDSPPFAVSPYVSFPSLAFKPFRVVDNDENNRILYYIDQHPNNKSGVYMLYRLDYVNGGYLLPISITPPEVELDANSGFFVTGSDPLEVDGVQPKAIIQLSGKIVDKNIVSPFSVQTTVSQRLLNIANE